MQSPQNGDFRPPLLSTATFVRNMLVFPCLSLLFEFLDCSRTFCKNSPISPVKYVFFPDVPVQDFTFVDVILLFSKDGVARTEQSSGSAFAKRPKTYLPGFLTVETTLVWTRMLPSVAAVATRVFEYVAERRGMVAWTVHHGMTENTPQ